MKLYQLFYAFMPLHFLIVSVFLHGWLCTKKIRLTRCCRNYIVCKDVRRISEQFIDLQHYFVTYKVYSILLGKGFYGPGTFVGMMTTDFGMFVREMC